MRLDDFNVSRIKTANVLLWLMSLYLQYLLQVKIKFRLKCFNLLQNSENKPRGLYFSKALFEGLIFGGAYIRRGLSTEGNLRFKIDWASLIVGSKFTFFAVFYFVFEGNFPSTGPCGAFIWRDDLTEGFLRYEFGRLTGIYDVLFYLRHCRYG